MIMAVMNVPHHDVVDTDGTHHREGVNTVSPRQISIIRLDDDSIMMIVSSQMLLVNCRR